MYLTYIRKTDGIDKIEGGVRVICVEFGKIDRIGVVFRGCVTALIAEGDQTVYTLNQDGLFPCSWSLWLEASSSGC